MRGDKALFTVNGCKAGLAYLRVGLLRTTPASNSNLNHIRRQLAKLDECMKTVGSKIEQFNLHVKELRDNLALNGATTLDLLINLFQGYKAASDKSFVSSFIMFLLLSLLLSLDVSDTIDEDRLFSPTRNDMDLHNK